MGITYYPCGCMIARSMFGEREIMDLRLCANHAAKYQERITEDQAIWLEKNIDK